jgi:CRISPR-associated endonuclease/helicase Cas3
MQDTPEARTDLAHAKKNPETGEWHEHSLIDHLNGTASMAEKFASEFNNGDWARLAGMLHDLGKYNPDWQSYLKTKTGYDPEAHLENSGAKVEHSTAGAIHAQGVLGGVGKILAYLIAGHHAGLPDWYHEISVGGALEGRLQENMHIERAKRGSIPPELLNPKPPSSTPCISGNPEYLHLWVRMLFSCLVDADYLDTEMFMDDTKNAVRSESTPDILSLKLKFDEHMDKKEKDAPDIPINQVRKNVLKNCRESGAMPPSFFSLTVPTGGGKTLASMGFALEHAKQYNKRRIIVVIPYTSIIEQTAEVLRGVFGENCVLEHHCNLDPDKENEKNRLASENWDAPIIVTTNVQFFESLFASRTSSCRKLHNIVESIVILDEAQMLPPEYLKPILSVLKGLVQCFGVSALLCTATQPALTGEIGSQDARFKGIENVREIISNPTELSNKLKRVELVPQNKELKPVEWEALAEELHQYEQVLCIVNTRKDCRELYRELHKKTPEGTIHLSALMCPAHRSDVIEDIKGKLRNGETLRVVSTQLVEAGVDLDFPVVYRALAGLDSLVQAAGRCNREGKLLPAMGKVFYFASPKQAPPGLMRKGEQACREIIGTGGALEFDPQAFVNYFQLFFKKENNFETKKIIDKLKKNAVIGNMQFRTAAREFNLIDDKMQRQIIAIYPKQKSLINELIAKLQFSPSRETLRKLQRFAVSVPVNDFAELQRIGGIRLQSGIWVQAVDDLYDKHLGFVPKKSMTWDPECYIL